MKVLLRPALKLGPTLVLALMALPLTAQTVPKCGPRAERIALTLHLSDTQKTSMRAIREKHRPDLVVRRDAVQQAQAALRRAFKDAATPDTQLRALHDKAAGARFDMMLARRSVHQEVQALLTPEQRVKAAEMRGAAEARRHERRHHLRQAAGLPG